MVEARIKSRRLGYLKVLGKYVEENQNLKSRLFNKRFEDYALQFEKSLSQLAEQSGVIISNNGKSAEPYISMAESLEFLIRSNKEYLVNEEFRIYASTIAKVNDSNIFVLSSEDIQFFLNCLLQFDSEIIMPLLRAIISRNKLDTISNTRSEFLSQLRLSLNDKISEKTKQAINRIELSNLYRNELFLPRLHWMIDLKIIHINSMESKIALTEFGEKTCTDLGLNLK